MDMYSVIRSFFMMFAEFNSSGSTLVVAPLEAGLKLHDSFIPLLVDPSTYRKLVGKLNYLTNTRPNLAFTVQFLSQFMQKPSEDHLKAALHTIRYLQGTPDLGILLNSSQDFKLLGFSDSD